MNLLLFILYFLTIDVAENVFTRCTTSNVNNPDDPNYTITFNYEFLDDMYSDWGDKDTSDSSSTLGEQNAGKLQ